MFPGRGAAKVGLTRMSRVDVSINRLARDRYGVVGLRELRAVAISAEAIRTRLKDGRLHCLHRGVFAVGPGRFPRRGWWRAATLTAGRGAMLSHLHGAALRDLVTAPRVPIDVLVPDRWLRDRKGLRFHSVARLAPFERDEIDGIPVTSLARTLLDCATVVDGLTHRRMYERAQRLQILDLTAIREVLRLRRGAWRGRPSQRTPRLRPNGCGRRGFRARALVPRPPSLRRYPGASGQCSSRRASRRLLLAGCRPRRRAGQLRASRRSRRVRARPRQDRGPARRWARGGSVHLSPGHAAAGLGGGEDRALLGARIAV